MIKLEQAILRTLSWFDLYQHPLTVFECWHYLWSEDDLGICTQAEIHSALVSLAEKGIVKNERGFWQLADSSSYAISRLERARWSISKRRRAQRAARLIMHLPFIRLVALVNTLSFGGAKRESDIDLLIIVRRGRLYLGRLLVTAIMQILGWRRHGRRVADRICLSFYLTDDHLDIKSLAYDDDPYLVYWLATLYPLASSDTELDLLKANSWLERSLPHRFLVGNISPALVVRQRSGAVVEKLLASYLGNMLEYLARRLQLYLIKRHHQSRLGDGTTAVVVSDSVLKFHESDQRPALAVRWRGRVHEVLAKAS